MTLYPIGMGPDPMLAFFFFYKKEILTQTQGGSGDNRGKNLRIFILHNPRIQGFLSTAEAGRKFRLVT